MGPFLFASFGKEAGLPLGSLHISFLGSWVGWVGRCQEAFWAPGSDGWAAAKKLGFMFPSFWVLGPDGWPRQRSWAPLTSLHISFLGSWVGWVVRPGSWAPVELLSRFLLSGSWVGSGREAGLPLGSLHVSFFLGPGSDGWAAAKKLGSHWTPFVFLFCAPGSDGWSAAKKLGFRWAPFTDGWAAATELDARHVPFLGSWVSSCSRLGWMGRAHKAGLQWPPFAAKAAPITKLPSCFVFGLLGWMGGPRDFYCLVSRQILDQICAAKFLLFPARQPHNAYIKLFYSKILCSMLVGQPAGKKSGSVPCEETITATHLACQALLQQYPVQYARRRVCGKSRDRFRLKNHFVCLVSRQISIPTFCNRHMQQRRQCCSNCSKNVLLSVRGFSGGKNADKSRPTAFAKSRYARQTSHLFPCDSQTNRMPNVLCVLHKRIQQRPRIHPSRKVTLCNGCGRNVDCFRAGGAAAPRSCVRRSSFGLRKKSTTGSCKRFFIAL